MVLRSVPVEWDETDIQEFFGLPDFPDEMDIMVDEPAAQLFISQFNADKVMINRIIPLADAQDYCSRDDTRGEGWFVGWYAR